MICWHSAILDELNDTRLWQGVEVCAEQKLNRFRAGLLVTRSEAVPKVFHNLPQLLHQHHALDELDVAKLRVPVYVGRADQDWLGHVLNRLRLGKALLIRDCHLQ